MSRHSSELVAMTRPEFDGGWKVLRGAGLPTTTEPDPNVFYGALRELQAEVWKETVRRAASTCTFFPVIASLRDIAYSVLRDNVAAKTEAKRLPAGRDCVEFTGGHPALPKRPGEGFCEYMERLGISLGYATGVAESDPRVDEAADAAKLAAAMRADANRAPKKYWEEK